ncbi:MAG: hypothetical protein GXN97_02025 [Aquificae bacterium]|nr:hypothetical protein [Aquificota bacterium]
MIENFLKRKFLIATYVTFLLLLTVFLIKNFYQTKVSIIGLHNEYKRFLFLLENVKIYQQKPLTEKNLKFVIQKFGLSLEKIEKIPNGFKIVIKTLPADKFLKFIHTLEKYGTIEKIQAIDNTGQGKFHTEILIKTFNNSF